MQSPASLHPNINANVIIDNFTFHSAIIQDDLKDVVPFHLFNDFSQLSHIKLWSTSPQVIEKLLCWITGWVSSKLKARFSVYSKFTSEAFPVAKRTCVIKNGGDRFQPL